MEFRYAPDKTNVTYQSGKFSGVDMDREISRYILSAFVKDKRLRRFAFEIGSILDGDNNNLTLSQRQELLEGIKKSFRRVTKFGSAKVEDVAKFVGEPINNEAYDAIKEYEIQELDDETTLASIFRMPTQEQVRFSRDIRPVPLFGDNGIGDIIYTTQGKGVDAESIKQIADDETPFGTLKLTKADIAEKIFESGYNYYYSDFDISYDTKGTDKYNYLLNLGFTKIDSQVVTDNRGKNTTYPKKDKTMPYLEIFTNLVNSKKFRDKHNIENPLFSKLIDLGSTHRGTNEKLLDRTIEIYKVINIPSRSSIVPKTTNQTVQVDPVTIERLPAFVLDNIEEAISRITTNYDTLENEIQQGVIR